MKPTILGLKKSFGYGDRLGLACPGHIAASKKFDFAGIFAQQSIRELTRTDRTAEEVMRAAQIALAEANYDKPWGADADHLKTPEDVTVTADAGYTFFTIDPSEFVENRADTMTAAELEAEVAGQVREGLFGDISPEPEYLGKSFEISETDSVKFYREPFLRAVAKYGRSIAHVETLAGCIAQDCSSRLYEIEVSIDETDTPTSPLEHLFFALELKRRGIVVVSLAPRFVGDFEKGVDFRGNTEDFENSLTRHAAIAEAFGPYKLSMHSGSDKLTVYPIFGRVCGELMHVKTAGTSYLEALRVILQKDIDLFLEIACYSAGRFETDIASYHISTTLSDIQRLGHGSVQDMEDVYLNRDVGRQLLHVTFGSVLTQGRREGGQPFKDAILEILHSHSDLYREVLERHFAKHLQLLCTG